MKTLQIIIGLIFALSIMACASKPVQPTVVPGPKMEIKATQPAPEPPPKPKAKDIGWGEVSESWKRVSGPSGSVRFLNPETGSKMMASLLSTKRSGGPALLIIRFRAKIESMEERTETISPIEFSEDRLTAWFRYSYKKNKRADVTKGKVVILLVRDAPENTVICQCEWPESAEDQTMKDFNQFWMGIGLEDSSTETE